MAQPPVGASSDAQKRADGAPTVVGSVTTGLLVGVLSVTLSTSLAALVYGAALGQYLDKAISLAILSSLVLSGIALLLTSIPGMWVHLQDAPAAILSGAVVSLVAAQSVDTPPEVTFMTVVALSALCALATGVAFVTFGLFRLGRLVRFLPLPVVGGFMAGTGWLLVIGGIRVMSGVTVSTSLLGDLFAPGTPVAWLPGLVFALAILVATRLSSHFLVWPLLLVGGIGCFYLVMHFSGGSVGAWQAEGHLLGPFPSTSLMGAVHPSDLAQVDWAVVFGHLPTVATTAGIALLALLFNATAIEMVSDKRVDFNRELRVAGLGNLLSGALGGSVGYPSASMTTLNYKVGTGSRLAMVVAWLVLLCVLLFGASLFSYMPTAIVGGISVYLGLAFLHEWLVGGLRRLSSAEYSVVVVILVVVAAVGFLPGVTVGLVLTVVLFVVSYSRVDAIRHALSGADLRSRVKRSPAERQALDESGTAVLVLQLHGFLFFGTANSVLERIDRRVKSGPAIDCVILDFRRVTGIDSSAAQVLSTLSHRATSHGFELSLTELGPALTGQLRQRGLGAEGSGALHLFDSLDDALEFSERRRLNRVASEQQGGGGIEPLDEALAGSAVDSKVLVAYLDRITVAAGESLVRQGEAPDALYIVANGRLTARLDAYGQPARRLETMSTASLVGELGFYANVSRTASVIADVDSEVYRLTREALARFEAEEPRQAANLHALVARLMAERMVHLLGVVEALQR